MIPWRRGALSISSGIGGNVSQSSRGFRGDDMPYMHATERGSTIKGRSLMVGGWKDHGVREGMIGRAVR